MEQLSLIIPSYNNARYLKDTINSIFGGITSLGYMGKQTLLPDQVVIVDDGSSDNTEEVVSEMQKNHSIIVYHKLQKNSGTAIACNKAIELSTGKFITRIDSDDMRESFSLENMMKAQELNPDSYIYDDIRIFLNGKRKDKVWKMYDYDFSHLLKENLNHAGIMFSKESWKLSGGYPPVFSDGRDDWAFNVALGAIGCCGIHIEGAGYLYRREGYNRTLKNSSSERQLYYHEKMLTQFKNLYEGRWNMSCCGNRGKRTQEIQSSSSRTQPILSGASGMTLVQYNGENYGKEPFFGPVTGAMYEFSKTKNVKNVDNRDLHTDKFKGLLDLTLHGKNIFSIYEVPEQRIEVSNLNDSGTLIEIGQSEDLSEEMIDNLKSSGISTWELFIVESSEKLSEITGLSVNVIDGIKSFVTSE